MRDLLNDIDAWRAAGKKVALARVVDVEGSGPRGPGAAMAVTSDGEVVGSVSGGCVEGAVVTEALALLACERQPGIVTFGYSDDDAFAVGLTCGGTIRLYLDSLADDHSSDAPPPGDHTPRHADQHADRFVDWYADLAEQIRAEAPVALVTVVAGPGTGASLLVRPGAPTLGTLGNDELDRVAARDALAELEAGRSGVRHYGPEGQTTPEDLVGTPVVDVFVESWARPPQMWIFGAVDFTAALARVAKILGYRVSVLDAREIFATRRRFPMADEVRVTWPGPFFGERGADLGPRDAVCILTHDPKFDVPAVQGALATAVGYIGVMGSRTTHEKRLERLAEVGITQPHDLDRLMSPIGLDIGARTPEETAISICAEIIARRTGRLVPSLRDGDGPIHQADEQLRDTATGVQNCRVRRAG